MSYVIIFSLWKQLFNSLYAYWVKDSLKPVEDRHFRGCSRRRGAKRLPHTYLTVMKLGTVIPYLKKTQKIYESRDTPLDLCWNQLFYCKIANFAISENTNIDCILVHFWDFKGFFNKNGYNFDNVTKIGYSRAS